MIHYSLFLFYFLKDFICLFLERGKEREKERERNTNVWLPLIRPLLGTWPATQACALTGNRTGDPLVHRLALNPLSHTSQGLLFKDKKTLWSWTIYLIFYVLVFLSEVDELHCSCGIKCPYSLKKMSLSLKIQAGQGQLGDSIFIMYTECHNSKLSELS